MQDQPHTRRQEATVITIHRPPRHDWSVQDCVELVCDRPGHCSIDLAIQERIKLCQRIHGRPRRSRREIEEETNTEWQREWDEATVGRYLHNTIPTVARHRKMSFTTNHLLTQALMGHRKFRSYLHRFNKVPAPYCTFCAAELDTPEHVIFRCQKYDDTDNRTAIEQHTFANGDRGPQKMSRYLGNPTDMKLIKKIIIP